MNLDIKTGNGIMKKEYEEFFKNYQEAFSIIEECTDSYVFVYDLQKDYFSVSESALEVFIFGKSTFENAIQSLRSVIYPKDWEELGKELKAIKQKEKAQFNIEFRLINTRHEIVWVSGKGRTVYDKNGAPALLVGCISELGKHNKYDNITSLYCEDVLKEAYQEWRQQNTRFGAILLIGIDNFREINEKYGVKTGDEILLRVAEIIIDCCYGGRENVFRFRGDEFAVVCMGEEGKVYSEVKKLYKRIRGRIDKFIENNGYHLFFTVSAGAAEFNTKEDTYDSVIKNAKFALHAAKLNGKNTFVTYSEEEYISHIRRIDIQEELRKSIENGFKGFEVYYQPIMNPESNTLYGSEALIRWNSEKYGFMSPVDFVPLLEESALIIPLGKWVIESAVKQCSEWVKRYPHFVMNINLSFVQIVKSDILKDAMELIDQYGLSHEHIVFEVTESGELENNTAVKNVLNSFNNKCFNLAIDDFGTGYSNLRYIRDMMFGIIKIDRLFIKDINESSQNYTLVKYVTEMAHNFNIKVCVEGVETQEEYEKVMTLNPDCIQGFFYGKPANALGFEEQFMNSKVETLCNA